MSLTFMAPRHLAISKRVNVCQKRMASYEEIRVSDDYIIYIPKPYKNEVFVVS
jgi:hypothetical protein